MASLRICDLASSNQRSFGSKVKSCFVTKHVHFNVVYYYEIKYALRTALWSRNLLLESTRTRIFEMRNHLLCTLRKRHGKIRI